MTPYDTYNLRQFANFCVPVFRGVQWVPINVLGRTCYTNKQIRELINLSSEEKRKAISCLYEAVQLLQVTHFRSCDDNQIFYDDDILWSVHTDGRTAVEANAGCCASVANWIVYILHDLYDEIGIVSIVSDIGKGHAVNYIYSNSKYYILDANAFLVEHKEYVCQETGYLTDFHKNKILTGAFFQVESLEAFAIFFSTFVGRMKQRTFLYCCHSGEICWEGFRKLPSGQIETFWPKGNTTIVGTLPQNVSVLFSHVPPISFKH